VDQKQNKTSREISRPLQTSNEKTQEQQKRDWIGEQLVILATAHDQRLTVERMRIYVEDLMDLTPEQLSIAFRRGRQESTFMPKIAELRGYAGASHEQVAAIEADVAWNDVMAYFKKWGWPHQRYFDGRDENGKMQFSTAPPLPPRIDYAMRQVGGIQVIAQADTRDLQFICKAFKQAFERSAIAVPVTLQLGLKDLSARMLMNKGDSVQ
jgi:hypothetical protein